MDGVNELTAFIYALLIIGCGVKIGAIIASSLIEENKEPYFKQIKHVILFFIIAISLTTVFDLITAYFGTL